MQVILYMATTINGYIAKETDETPWSNDEWQSYCTRVKDIGNIVIGRKTYDIMKKNNEFDILGNPCIVVVSKEYVDDNSDVIIAHSPKDALNRLEERNFTKALVAGGGVLNSSFMKAHLIDDIYLDIEPLIFGTGIPLFSDDNFDATLELIDSTYLSKNTIQLHYTVSKKISHST